MHRPTACLAYLLPLAAAGAFADWGDCDHRAPREATVAAADASSLDLRAGAGSLAIVGRADLDEVRIRGTACASKESLLDEIRLETAIRDGVVRVETLFPEDRGWNGAAALDLEIEVPARFAVAVEDGSGEIDIDGVAEVRVDDGSGSLEIRNVAGWVRVRDGSGEIDIRDSDGPVEIEDDGSGSIRITDVKSRVDIREDGSGSITIRGVGGSVRIDEDGSGSIRVDDVGGDLTVVDDGSGGISYDDVRGRVELPRS